MDPIDDVLIRVIDAAAAQQQVGIQEGIILAEKMAAPVTPPIQHVEVTIPHRHRFSVFDHATREYVCDCGRRCPESLVMLYRR